MVELSESRKVAAIVLAGGRSERLGRPKQLLEWRGRTLVEHVIEVVCQARGLEEVLVVLEPRVASVLGVGEGERLGCAVVAFPEAEGDGCAASYRSGLRRLAAKQVAAVVIVLADQPDLRTELIEQVVREWEGADEELLVTRYEDGEGHPILFGRAFFEELASLRGEKAAWKLVDRYRDRVRWVRVGEKQPRDIDTEEDYASLR